MFIKYAEGKDVFMGTAIGMKKILLLVGILLISAFALTACGDDGECEACNGTGYYNAVNCPMCDGSGYSDFDRSDIPIY